MRTLGATSRHRVILVFSRSLWPLFGNETILGLQTAAQGQTTKVARCVVSRGGLDAWSGEGWC